MGDFGSPRCGGFVRIRICGIGQDFQDSGSRGCVGFVRIRIYGITGFRFARIALFAATRDAWVLSESGFSGLVDLQDFGLPQAAFFAATANPANTNSDKRTPGQERSPEES